MSEAFEAAMNEIVGTIWTDSIFGMRIFYNSLCLETTKEPVRPYRRKRWQTAAQADRKRKKWIRRWGFVRAPCMFKAPFGLYAHPSLKPKIEAAISLTRP